MREYIALITGELETWTCTVRANNRNEAVGQIRELYPTQQHTLPLLVEDVRETAKVMTQRMDADWDKYHWVRETHTDDELIAGFIIPAQGNLTGALLAAKRHTDLLNEAYTNTNYY